VLIGSNTAIRTAFLAQVLQHDQGLRLQVLFGALQSISPRAYHGQQCSTGTNGTDMTSGSRSWLRRSFL